MPLKTVFASRHANPSPVSPCTWTVWLATQFTKRGPDFGASRFFKCGLFFFHDPLFDIRAAESEIRSDLEARQFLAFEHSKDRRPTYFQICSHLTHDHYFGRLIHDA